MTKPETERVYDLEERTAKVGEMVIRLCKPLAMTAVTDSIVRQLVRAVTSVGANYCEADDCDSRKDFRFKIGLFRREARESKHWLRMLAVAHELSADEARRLWREAHELNLIFGSIRRSLD